MLPRSVGSFERSGLRVRASVEGAGGRATESMLQSTGRLDTIELVQRGPAAIGGGRPEKLGAAVAKVGTDVSSCDPAAQGA